MRELPPSLRLLYPYAPRRLPLPLGEMSFVDSGRGHPVVCLHGNPTWSFFFRDLPEPGDGLRWIMPDHLGCGLSSLPEQALNFVQHADHVERLLDHLGLEKYSMVVHDWGGAIGCEMATRQPGRLQALVVLNTAAFPFAWMPLRIRLCRTPVLGRWAMIRHNLFGRAALRLAATRPLSPAVAEGFMLPWEERARRRTVADFVADIPMRPTHPSHAALVALGERLAVLREKPVQIVWGMRDFCFNHRFLAAWRQRLPDAGVIELPTAGHYLLEDGGEAARAPVREFLRAVKAAE